MRTFLDFERPIADVEGKIKELRALAQDGDINLADDIARLETKVDRLLRTTYDRLTPVQKVEVARHPSRPRFADYADRLLSEFVPLAGDRLFGEDSALVGGIGRFRGRTVVAMGHEKGSDTDSRVRSNFGMAKPEGYRKAQRLMRLAERFALPIVSFVDTPGAYPGVASEERGQAEAIARSIDTCLQVRVPLIAVVIGEGGSGGAIAIAAADRVIMLEHAVYSVISPEGCASILWRSAQQNAEAATALRLTAQDLRAFGLIDRIVEEPIGGAHRQCEEACRRVGDAIAAVLDDLTGDGAPDGVALVAERRQKFLGMGRPAAG